eukprot:4515756-Pyramimonas_sp.AAC.1
MQPAALPGSDRACCLCPPVSHLIPALQLKTAGSNLASRILAMAPEHADLNVLDGVSVSVVPTTPGCKSPLRIRGTHTRIPPQS